MEPISPDQAEKTTKKWHKTNRSRIEIAKKIIAFQELTSLEQNDLSAREAAALVGIANSTMQSWTVSKEPLQEVLPPETLEFLALPAGIAFVQTIVFAANFQIHHGASGVRGMMEFIRNAKLHDIVACSYGALYEFNRRCDEQIISFEKAEVARLAEKLRHRKIVVGLDELFRRRKPCLVAIEAISNYILLQKFTEDRTADTWKTNLEEVLKKLPVEIGEVVSDLGTGILSCTKDLGAEHSPDLFHAQQELTKGVAGPVATQERGAAQQLDKAEKQVKEATKKWGPNSKRAKKAAGKVQLLRSNLERKKPINQAVKAAMKEIRKAYHPVNLNTGNLQTPEGVKSTIDQQLIIIEANAKTAKLAASSQERLDKAQRAFDGMASYMRYFLTWLALSIGDLKLTPEQVDFFHSIAFPLAYLTLVWKKLSKEEKESVKPIMERLEAQFLEVPWPEALKAELLERAQEFAARFQRSSSFVEGQNGHLSLEHHRGHRLNERKIKAMTVVQNFYIKRNDGTTAANRFFEQDHEDLFEFLVNNVRIPRRPNKKVIPIGLEDAA